MSSNLPVGPHGDVVNIGIPDSMDIPRLIYAAPYFQQVPLAELIEPSVIEAVNNVLPSLVPPYVQAAADQAVTDRAVLLVGSTMSGPLFLSPLMPTQPSQAATMAYVDSMIATAGIPEVPPVPTGQVWARETGQWVPITPQTGVFLPLAGGSMTGNISMSGNTINNLAAVPALPNGAAPAQWVLNQISAVSLFQGQWDADTNVPDLTQLSYRVNGYTWIAITTSVSGVVVGQAIPGLQGKTIFNGDTIIYSTVDGAFFSIHAGGMSVPEANSLFVQLTGSQMSGALLLNANASQPLQAVTLQQLEAFVPPGSVAEAPNDGQGYLRNGLTHSWLPGLPLAGGIMTGPITLSANAGQPLQAVPLQQMTSAINAAVAGYLPLAGNATMSGLFTLSGNATANLNPVPLQQLNSMLAAYLPLSGGTLTGNLGGTTISLSGALTLPAGSSTTPALNIGGGGLFFAGGAITTSQQLSASGIINSQTGFNTPGTLNVTGAITTSAAMTVPAGISYTVGGNAVAFTFPNSNLALTVNGSSYGQVVISPGTTGESAINNMGLNGNNSTIVAGYGTTGQGVSWTVTFSDRRLKTNIGPVTIDALGLVNQIAVYASDLTNPFPGAVAQHWDCSLIADELETTIPAAFVAAPNDQSYQSVNALPLVTTLWRATQQLIGMIQQLQGAVGTLQQGANQTVTAWTTV